MTWPSGNAHCPHTVQIGAKCIHRLSCHDKAELRLCPGHQSVPIAERQLACSVFVQDDTPLLHVAESCTVPNHKGITLRKYAIHSVDDDTAVIAAQRATSGQSELIGHCLQALSLPRN